VFITCSFGLDPSLGPVAWTGEDAPKLVHVVYRRAALVVL